MKRKLLYLSPYFWPEEIGSASYATDLAIHLRNTGYDVQVEAFRPHYPDPAYFEPWANGDRGVEIHESLKIHRAAVRPRGNGGFAARVANDLGYLFHVLRGLVKGRFRQTDVTVAYVPTILTLYAALAVRLFTGSRIVAVVHDIESGLASALDIVRGRMVLRLMRQVERIGLNRADHVIVLTEGMRAELQRLGCRRPISVVPIWAATADWRDPVASPRATLLYSGNFGKKQNLDQILPLLARLDQDGAPVDVVLRGDGSERARIAAAIAERGIRHVRFLPFAPAEDFTATLQDAHIHLVPQAQNVANYALPSKLISIMGAGRPFVCIASKDSPLDTLARESKAGFCVAPGAEDDLFRVVSELARNPAQQALMGRNGQSYVRAYMDREKILDQYADIIDAVARSSGKPGS